MVAPRADGAHRGHRPEASSTSSTGRIKQGHPLDLSTQVGAQVSAAQRDKIEHYVQIGLDEGAELLVGGMPAHLGDLDGISFWIVRDQYERWNRPAFVLDVHFLTRPPLARD